MNLPNSITLIRIFSIPLLMWILLSGRFSSATGEKELLASALFIAASMTDGIDGYLARKRGQVTTMGILLDPLADKLLIAAAFVTLVQFNPILVPAWIAVIVIGREFLVSGLRSIAASEGFTIEASDLGKFKMVVQIVSVVAVILDHRWTEWPIYSHYFFSIYWIAQVAIWFMVCVSLASAIDYFAAFWSKIDRRVVKRRRRAFILSRRRKPVPPPRPTAMSLPQPSSAAVESGESSQGEFSRDERILLLQLAHDSILSALERREISLTRRPRISRNHAAHSLPFTCKANYADVWATSFP